MKNASRVRQQLDETVGADFNAKGTGKHLCPLLDLILHPVLQESLTIRSNNSLAHLPAFSVISTLISAKLVD